MCRNLLTTLMLKSRKPSHKVRASKKLRSTKTEPLADLVHTQSCSKLITKSIASRYPTPAVLLAPFPAPSQKGSFDLSPSNQLAPQIFHLPSHYASRPGITAEDASITSQMSTVAQDGLNNTHISTATPSKASPLSSTGNMGVTQEILGFPVRPPTIEVVD